MPYDDFWTVLNTIGSMGERGNSSEISSTFYFTYNIRIWIETCRCNTSMTRLWYFCYDDEDFDFGSNYGKFRQRSEAVIHEIINAASHVGHKE